MSFPLCVKIVVSFFGVAALCFCCLECLMLNIHCSVTCLVFASLVIGLRSHSIH
jgi:hypothetical protein